MAISFLGWKAIRIGYLHLMHYQKEEWTSKIQTMQATGKSWKQPIISSRITKVSPQYGGGRRGGERYKRRVSKRKCDVVVKCFVYLESKKQQDLKQQSYFR